MDVVFAFHFISFFASFSSSSSSSISSSLSLHSFSLTLSLSLYPHPIPFSQLTKEHCLLTCEEGQTKDYSFIQQDCRVSMFCFISPSLPSIISLSSFSLPLYISSSSFLTISYTYFLYPYHIVIILLPPILPPVARSILLRFSDHIDMEDCYTQQRLQIDDSSILFSSFTLSFPSFLPVYLII